jgi:hypothetical protein
VKELKLQLPALTLATPEDPQDLSGIDLALPFTPSLTILA